MIRPSEVSPSAPDAGYDVCDLRAQFDDAIRLAAASGHWPAIVRDMRDGCTMAALEATVAEYRAAGWVADVGHQAGIRATIDHPDREQLPAPGWMDRAVDRARREGVLPPTAIRQS